MKIFYILSAYISHRQAGLEYIACLQSLGHTVCCNYPRLLAGEADNATLSRQRSHEFALDPELAEYALEADLVIIHEDPSWHDKIYELLPGLIKKRTIACMPWENATLPEAFVRPLGRFESIWTPSEFCRQAFASRFSNVQVLPHVVRRPRADAAARAWLRALLDKHGATGRPVFFSAVDGLNPRKNLAGLLTAFSLFQKNSRIPGCLFIKQYRAIMPLGDRPGVFGTGEDLDEAQMVALYAGCAAYVSAHRTEGWGLGMSTAMALGKPVIATGYSGNMEFMNASNSIPIPYTLEHVSQQMAMRIPLFTPDMLWAAPDLGAMASAMTRVAEGRLCPNIAREAAQITRRFGREAIAARLEQLLALQ